MVQAHTSEKDLSVDAPADRNSDPRLPALTECLSINLIIASLPDVAFSLRASRELLTLFSNAINIIVIKSGFQTSVDLLGDRGQGLVEGAVITQIEGITELNPRGCYITGAESHFQAQSGSVFLLPSARSDASVCLADSLLQLIEAGRVSIHAMLVLGGEHPLVRPLYACAKLVCIEAGIFSESDPLGRWGHYCQRSDMLALITRHWNSDAALLHQPYPQAEEVSLLTLDGGNHQQLLKILKKQTKVDFSNFQQKALFECTYARCEALGFDVCSDYIHFLEAKADEVDAIFDYFRFCHHSVDVPADLFRLYSRVLEYYLSINLTQEGVMRVWLPAVAHSVDVMLFLLAWNNTVFPGKSNITLQLIATDMDAKTTKSKLFPLTEATVELLAAFCPIEQWLIRSTGTPVLSTMKHVVFIRHNLLEDIPFSKIDLIVCRNSLQLFKDRAKRGVIASFYDSMNEGGLLLIDGDGVANQIASDFFLGEGLTSLYRKSEQHVQREPVSGRPSAVAKLINANISPPTQMLLKHHRRKNRYLDYADVMDKIIDHYMMPGLLINQSLEIVHTIGDLRPLQTKITTRSFSHSVKERLAPRLADRVLREVQQLFIAKQQVDTERRVVFLYSVDDAGSDEKIKVIIHLFNKLSEDRSSKIRYALLLFDAAHDPSTSALTPIEASPALSGGLADVSPVLGLPDSASYTHELDTRASPHTSHDADPASPEPIYQMYDDLSRRYERQIEHAQVVANEKWSIFKEALEGLTVGIVILSNKEKLLYFNASAQSFCGFIDHDLSTSTWQPKLRSFDLSLYQALKKFITGNKTSFQFANTKVACTFKQESLGNVIVELTRPASSPAEKA